MFFSPNKALSASEYNLFGCDHHLDLSGGKHCEFRQTHKDNFLRCCNIL